MGRDQGLVAELASRKVPWLLKIERWRAALRPPAKSGQLLVG